MLKTNNDSIIKRIYAKVKKKILYFGDESNLHGVGHVLSMSYIPILKRLFWFIILVSCGLGAAGILQAALSLYSGDVVSFSVETNYLNWDTQFPAVTICEQLDPDRVKHALTEFKLPSTLATFFKEVTYWNIKYCRSCTSCKINQTCVQDFQQYIDRIRLKCTELLTQCWWNNKPFSCCDRFLPVQTEYGLCFSFNSLLTINSSELLSINRRVGLPDLVFSATRLILIKVHAPDDRVSTSMESALGRVSSLPLITDFEAILKAEQTISDVSVQALTSTQRGCLFAHEQPAFAHLWPFHEYTYSGCLMYCRAVKQLDMCNCTHHYLPKLKDFSTCDILGLSCLYKKKDSLITVDCECPMACEEILYKLVHIFNYRHTDKVTAELTQRGTRGRIRLVQLPALRVRRHAIRDTLGLVVDVGGVGGVFFGASLLSVIEIVYLFCIRRGL